MLKLLRLLKNYEKECILGPLIKLTEVIFELTVPLVVAKIIDNGITAGDKPYILKMCGVLALFAVGGLLCAVVAQYFSAKAAVGFATDIRSKLFSHIEKLSFSQLDSLGASTLITRLTGDINQVQTGTNLTLRLVLRSPFVVFGAVIMAFTVDSGSAVVFTVAVPVLAAVVFAVMLVCIPLYKKVQQRLDGLLGKTRENLLGTRVIRAFCKENEEISDFDTKNELLNNMQIKVGKISAIMNPATFALVNFAVIALIYTGALRVGSGKMSGGDVVAQYNYMSQILIELIKLASLIISVTKSVACGNRIQAVLDIEPEMQSGTVTDGEKHDCSVEFKNATLCYGSGESALDNINLKLERGKSYGIIGSTGSGKTSLINLIPRFYDVTGGKVTVDGIDVREMPQAQLHDLLGYVPQKGVLFSGTIDSNLKFGGEDITDAQVHKAAAIAQATDFIEAKSEGYQSPIAQGGSNVSGGQKQRLSIARAIAKNPKVYLFDDSFSALDYKTDVTLRRALKAQTDNATVIIVAQRISTVLHANQILVLDEGKLVGKGTHAQLMVSCPEYQEIARSQLSQKELALDTLNTEKEGE